MPTKQARASLFGGTVWVLRRRGSLRPCTVQRRCTHLYGGLFALYTSVLGPIRCSLAVPFSKARNFQYSASPASQRTCLKALASGPLPKVKPPLEVNPCTAIGLFPCWCLLPQHHDTRRKHSSASCTLIKTPSFASVRRNAHLLCELSIREGFCSIVTSVQGNMGYCLFDLCLTELPLGTLPAKAETLIVVSRRSLLRFVFSRAVQLYWQSFGRAAGTQYAGTRDQ